MTPAQFTEIRKELGLKRSELAREIGITRQRVTHLETGDKPIPILVSRALMHRKMNLPVI